MAEKTHDPTPKRLREAREKGDVARAPLVAGALGLLAATVALRPIVVQMIVRFRASFVRLEPVERIDPWPLATAVLMPVASIAIVLLAVAVVSGVVLGSVTFSFKRLAPDPSRLEPFSGLARLVDKSRAWAALRGVLVTIVVVALVAGTLARAAASGGRAVDMAALLSLAGSYAIRIAFVAGGVGLALAVIDVVIGRRVWLGKLKMSRDEVIREHKEGEGDPEIKRRREELHHELLAGEAVAAVRDATVVVVNPTHLACALRYARGEVSDEEAPTLVTKGQGALAARIIQAAKAYGVPIVRDVPVARALYDLDVGTEIPEVLYEAVAEVLRAAWEGGEDDA